MSRPPSPYFPKTSPFFDTPFNKWEPFDCPPRPQWLLDVAHKYDADLDPAGSPFQTGLLLDTTETPGYTLSIAGSHTGKSRALLMETIIMCIGKVPICLAFDKGVDTGIPREVNEWNIKVFGNYQTVLAARSKVLVNILLKS